MYECRKCKLTSDNKLLFLRRSDRPGQMRNICIACRNKQQKQYVKASRDKKREALNALKNVPCADCGGLFPPYVMDFDHMGDKEFVISDALARVTLERILEEVKKCDIVCANCHRIRTHKRHQYS